VLDQVGVGLRTSSVTGNEKPRWKRRGCREAEQRQWREQDDALLPAAGGVVLLVLLRRLLYRLRGIGGVAIGAEACLLLLLLRLIVTVLVRCGGERRRTLGLLPSVLGAAIGRRVALRAVGELRLLLRRLRSHRAAALRLLLRLAHLDATGETRALVLLLLLLLLLRLLVTAGGWRTAATAVGDLLVWTRVAAGPGRRGGVEARHGGARVRVPAAALRLRPACLLRRPGAELHRGHRSTA
jgi:hypothetical protein